MISLNFYTLLKLHQRIKSPKLKLLGVYFANIFGFRHYSVRVDPALHCNLECVMCYFSDSEFKKGYKGLLTLDEIKGISNMLFPKALQVVVGCGAEPTIHKNFMLLIEEAKRHNVPNISMVTNGLLLTEEHINQLAELKLNELIISLHGINKDSYETMMKNADYDKFINLLNTLKQTREKHNYPKIRINYTVNSQNMEELDNFWEIYGSYPIDALQIRPVMEIGGIYSEPIKKEQQETYRSIISKLKSEAIKRGVIFMANTDDVEYKKVNADAELINALYRYISPRAGKQLNISWTENSYSDYIKATSMRKNILKALFGFKSSKNNIDRSLRYELT